MNEIDNPSPDAAFESTVDMEKPLPVLSPVEQSNRIQSLDVIRGFALLGILAPNIYFFSSVANLFQNPTLVGDFVGPNVWIWFGTHLFFDLKFMTIFSTLFGAGIMLMSTRAAEKGRKVVGLHYRRMLWLLLFGLFHAYVLWYGDILVAYALGGMIVFWLRNLRPLWQIIIGLLMISVASIALMGIGWSFSLLDEETYSKVVAGMTPNAETTQAEIDAYRGGWVDQMPFRASVSAMFQILLFPLFTFWRTGGLMVIGMALFKLGILSGEKSNRFYGIFLALGFLVGLPAIAYELNHNMALGFDPISTQFFGIQINYWASLLVSAAYISGLILLWKNNIAKWLTDRFAAVGRMAFSNYFFHTIVCTFIFYGHGLGQFAYLSRLQCVAIVLAIWIFQLIVSPIWLKHFRFGPLEWLWRSLVYWKRQPMRVEST